MRKFCENEIDCDWKSIKIDNKWTGVVVESPDIISEEDRLNLLMQCDDALSGYRFAGNDVGYNEAIWYYADIPEKIPKYFTYSEENSKLYFNKIDEFRKKWKCSPIGGDGKIFAVYLLSSCYISIFSFFNFRTGKVGLVKDIGKWLSIEETLEELEWFRDNYPQYKMFITFCNNSCFCGKDCEPLVTIMIYNGKIKAVPTRTFKDFKYCYKINQLKCSTCAKKSIIFKPFDYSNEHYFKLSETIDLILSYRTKLKV